MNRFVSYTNGNGTEYVFNKIISLTGFECGPLNVVTTQNSLSDGAEYVSGNLDVREVEITVEVAGETTADMQIERRRLINDLSVKGNFGVLRHNYIGHDVKLNCKPVNIIETPIYTRASQFLIRFMAVDPFFYDTVSQTCALNFVQKFFVFPVTFPTKFGEFTNVGTIINAGDAPAPVLIRFYGGATGPKFTNNTTGQYVQLTGTIPDDHILEIDTTPGHKSVAMIDAMGVKTDAYGMLDYRSEFWQLAVGENVIEYAESAGTSGSHGEIIYYNRYVGV